MPSHLDRRTFLGRGLRVAGGLGLLGAAPAALSACAGTGSRSSAGSGSAVGVSSAAPKRGGKLVVGVTSETDGFNPVTSRWAQSGIMYARAVFDPLAAVGADGSVKPYLARSITPNQDYSVWTIGLRPNVYFHDGEPLSAAAVSHNLDIFVHGLNGTGLSNVNTVQAVDDMTVSVTMKEPWVPFPLYLTGQIGYMASPKMLADPNGSQHPIGTGPFVFKEWVPSDHFTANANKTYWRRGLPYLDQIEFRPISDDQARESTLRSGGIDIMQTTATQSIVNLRNDSSLSYIDDPRSTIGEPDVNFIMLNTAVRPLDDSRVRRRARICHRCHAGQRSRLHGVLTPVNGPFSPGSPFYTNTGYPAYDLSKAKALVASYRRDNGPISFELADTTGSPQANQQNQLVQAMWKQAGVSTHLAQYEQSTFINNFLLGKYQAYSMSQYAAPDPDANYIFWHSKYSYPVGQLAINFSRNKDPQIDAALELGRTSPEPTTRAQAYKTVFKRLAADIPNVRLSRTIWANAARPAVTNFANPSLPDSSPAQAFADGDLWLGQIWLQR